jgi:hypothetical protein
MLRQKTTLSRSSPLRTSQTRLEYKVHRKCSNCGTLFEKRSMTHVACSIPCAQAIAASKRERAEAKALKAERKQDKARKEALKTRKHFIAPAQTAVNAYVRLRDADLPCISCDKPAGASEALTGGGWDCGHFLSRGAHPNLRFDLRNMAKQCKRCNRDQSGNAGNFRRGLIARIGVEKVEALEADQAPRKHDVEWLKRFIKIMRKKTRRLEKRRGK